MCNCKFSGEIYVPSVWHTTFDLQSRTHTSHRTHSWLRFKQSKCVFVALISNPAPFQHLWTVSLTRYLDFESTQSISVPANRAYWLIRQSCKGFMILWKYRTVVIKDKKMKIILKFFTQPSSAYWMHTILVCLKKLMNCFGLLIYFSPCCCLMRSHCYIINYTDLVSQTMISYECDLVD